MTKLRLINWLASYPKSGNTWMRCFLQSYWLGYVNINDNSVVVTPDTSLSAYHNVSARPLHLLDDIDKLMLRMGALMQIRATHPYNPLVVKTHNANIRITAEDMTPVELIPGAMTKGAVYIIRDPRDVVVSYAKHIGQDIDSIIDAMANDGHKLVSKRNDEDIDSWLTGWSTHVKTWTEDSAWPCTVVRYEDMLQGPFHAFQSVLKALGQEEIDRADIDASIQQCSFNRLRAMEKREGFLEKSPKSDVFFDQGRAGRWRDVLTRKQVMRIEAAHGEQMVKNGYKLAHMEAA